MVHEGGGDLNCLLDWLSTLFSVVCVVLYPVHLVYRLMEFVSLGHQPTNQPTQSKPASSDQFNFMLLLLLLLLFWLDAWIGLLRLT